VHILMVSLVVLFSTLCKQIEPDDDTEQRNTSDIADNSNDDIYHCFMSAVQKVKV